ncbi:MAG TPA: RHS repeat-associated core domain-containing protein, partial [Chloroflexota bacterium]|nr:RHS repeat-associated core domain-containing protein [Chloroflexota bacterium]
MDTADSIRLFVQYSDGSVINLWQNPANMNDLAIDVDFTTPIESNSFQVGTEVVLDSGFASFSPLKLTAYSDTFFVNPSDLYQLKAQVTGSVTAGLGQGGRIYLVSIAPGSQPDMIWQNPTNFSGTTTMQAYFMPDPDDYQMRVGIETNLDAGHLTFSDFELQHLAEGDVIRRSTYSVAGQAIATKVSGDPISENNGIFYTYSDHLGSANAMRHPDGSVTQTRYLPFGGYRGNSGSNPITDRGYTGHKMNDSLGLIYMNARYYSPYINRFVSADSIVPNPPNPQTFNRYSYVNNRPLSKHLKTISHFSGTNGVI